MGQQDINCIVSDCYYWNKGNNCQADRILVTTDAVTANKGTDFDYEMAKELTPQNAGASTYTCCKTYKPRNYMKAPIGGG